jgi:hypothetical protein
MACPAQHLAKKPVTTTGLLINGNEAVVIQ